MFRRCAYRKIDQLTPIVSETEQIRNYGNSLFKQLIESDKDLFGDGSLVVLSTPGHTPGHQSLLVKLPKTGEVVLSGDAVHFKSNWENRGVPVNNVSKEQTLASMQKIADTLTKDKAQLWINHDKAQRDTLKMSPEFYD